MPGSLGKTTAESLTSRSSFTLAWASSSWCAMTTGSMGEGAAAVEESARETVDMPMEES